YGLQADDAAVPSPAGEPRPDVIVPPVPSAAEETRLPIFESVESDWFRRSRHGAERPATAAPTETWSSPADAGWQAAEVAQATVSAGTPAAGPPARGPKANLGPGTVSAAAAPPPPVPARSAAQAQERLAAFQRGIQNARAAAETTDGPERDGEADGEEDGDVTRNAELCPPAAGGPAPGARHPRPGSRRPPPHALGGRGPRGLTLPPPLPLPDEPRPVP